jgi:hypothetical protein
LLAECGAGYFAAISEAKTRFHRTLVEMGLIDLAARPNTAPAPAERSAISDDLTETQ